MSEDVRDLLTQGIAAAKAKDRKQARSFLERAARREDADRDQQATAWLWLSEISDDPAEKRRCLENTLACDMYHPLARRGLAILDGRLKPEDIIQPDNTIRRLKPQETRPSEVRRYVCTKCGGRMSLDTGRHMLRCDYCGQQMTEYDALFPNSAPFPNGASLENGVMSDTLAARSSGCFNRSDKVPPETYFITM